MLTVKNFIRNLPHDFELQLQSVADSTSHSRTYFGVVSNHGPGLYLNPKSTKSNGLLGFFKKRDFGWSKGFGVSLYHAEYTNMWGLV